ncbi:MAG: CopD family protein [Polaromonas sp.]|nr:CopD family protein [Polaromonas sp.]
MYEIIKLVHLSAAIVWVGGMTFMLYALRPAAMAALDAMPRARLMVAVMQRFFLMVAIAVLLLFTTGTNLYTTGFRSVKAATGVGSVPLGWNAMLVLGLLMFAIFGHIYFSGFRKFRRAVAEDSWPAAATAAARIHTLVVLNFGLGWLAIAALRLLR